MRGNTIGFRLIGENHRTWYLAVTGNVMTVRNQHGTWRIRIHADEIAAADAAVAYLRERERGGRFLKIAAGPMIIDLPDDVFSGIDEGDFAPDLVAEVLIGVLG